MQSLNLKIWQQRAEFLEHIRLFFKQADLLEVETPLWNAWPGFEVHLDSLQVTRSGLRKSVSQPTTQPGPDGYLITSPEYNLKILLAKLRRPLFQIAHCFREGDRGPDHSEEFLILEWYILQTELETLMDFCDSLLHYLYKNIHSTEFKIQSQRISVDTIMQDLAGTDLSRDSLADIVKREGWSQTVENLPYDDLFFLVFLNCIEPELKKGLYYLYNYPAELSSLSMVVKSRARRFEIYWNGMELANAYQELRFASEYQAAYARESQKRTALNRPSVILDAALIQALQESGGLPPCCGIALGLDRLFALLYGYKNLHCSSPFAMP